MKIIESFSEFINENRQAEKVIKKALPGYAWEHYGSLDSDEMEADGFAGAETFGAAIDELDGMELMVQIYSADGLGHTHFGFNFDGMPISTSLHNSSQRRSIATSGLDFPIDIKKLNSSVLDSVISDIQDNHM